MSPLGKSFEFSNSGQVSSDSADDEARINVVAARFVTDVESATMASLDVSHSIEANTKTIERDLGSESILFKQLGLCNTAHESLTGTLGSISPMLNDLDTSVKSMAVSGNHLVHELKGLSTRLRESETPAINPVFELELSNKFSENTELQLRLQSISSEAESFRQKLHELEAKNRNLEVSMAESSANHRTIERRGLQLEAENTCLHNQMESVKEEARKMIDGERAASKKDLQIMEDNGLQLKAKNNLLQNQVQSVQEEGRIMIAEEKAASKKDLQIMQHRELQLEAENDRLQGQLKSVSDEAQKVLFEEKAAFKKNIKLHHEEQIEIIQQEKKKLEEEYEALTIQLQGARESLVSVKSCPLRITWLIELDQRPEIGR